MKTRKDILEEAGEKIFEFFSNKEKQLSKTLEIVKRVLVKNVLALQFLSSANELHTVKLKYLPDTDEINIDVNGRYDIIYKRDDPEYESTIGNAIEKINKKISTEIAEENAPKQFFTPSEWSMAQYIGEMRYAKNRLPKNNR